MGVFPGIFTFAASSALVYFIWRTFLQLQPIYIVLPILMLLFLLFWIVLGKLSLIPVEDAIVDECQRALWGEVRLRSPPFNLKRLAREVAYSLGLGLLAAALILLTFIPPLAVLEFVLLAWLNAYSFLTPLYIRRVDSAKGRVTLFFGFPITHFLLGAFLNALLFVPVLNVFLLGYAQVIATLVYFHKEESLAR